MWIHFFHHAKDFCEIYPIWHRNSQFMSLITNWSCRKSLYSNVLIKLPFPKCHRSFLMLVFSFSNIERKTLKPYFALVHAGNVIIMEMTCLHQDLLKSMPKAIPCKQKGRKNLSVMELVNCVRSYFFFSKEEMNYLCRIDKPHHIPNKSD